MSLARPGSLTPGSCTTILSFPCLVIDGSDTPNSSILLRMTSRAWSIASAGSIPGPGSTT